MSLSEVNKTLFVTTVLFYYDFTAVHHAVEGCAQLRANRLLGAGIEPMTEAELNADVLNGALTLIRNWSVGMCSF